MIVVDASVVVNALADDHRDGDVARERLARAGEMPAPHLVDLEVMSVLRRHALRGDLDERRASQALADLAGLPLDRYPHWKFLSRVAQLRHALTARPTSLSLRRWTVRWSPQMLGWPRAPSTVDRG